MPLLPCPAPQHLTIGRAIARELICCPRSDVAPTVVPRVACCQLLLDPRAKEMCNRHQIAVAVVLARMNLKPESKVLAYVQLPGRRVFVIPVSRRSGKELYRQATT